jgi:tRNA-dihydrouridine synthase
LAYNGDIFSPDDFHLFEQRFPGIQRWMLGRGLLADPFLPALIKGKTLPDNAEDQLHHFINDLYLGYRKKMNDRLQAINVMKEIWSYLSLSFDTPGKVFGKVKKCKTFDDYEARVKEIFDLFAWQGRGGNTLLNKPL